MTRREQIKIASELEFERSDCSIGHCIECFISGADWADANPIYNNDGKEALAITLRNEKIKTLRTYLDILIEALNLADCHCIPGAIGKCYRCKVLDMEGMEDET